MSDPVYAPQGFAYLFERYPSFTQTFCVREVESLHARGVDFPAFSIRKPANEPQQDCFAHAGTVIDLPQKFDEWLANDASFRRSSRKGIDELRDLWGSEEQKHRIYEALWLGPVLRQAGIRHVHVHFAGTAARTAFWTRKLFGVNYSVTAHANDIFRDEPPERLEQIFDAARFVVTVSDFSLRFLRENYPKQSARFCRVYNGINTSGYSQSAFPPGRPLILSVGRYIEKKGFSTLVDACARLGARDFECQIIGGGRLGESLRQQAAALGVSDRVHITGPKTEGEIKELLARTLVFALPCLVADDGAMDNLPTVIMEAMAAGVPVISTNLAAIPEMIIDGQTGYIVPERDPEALAARLAEMINDRAAARALGAGGLERCRTLFDSTATTTALLEVFQSHGALSGRDIPDSSRRAA